MSLPRGLRIRPWCISVSSVTAAYGSALTAGHFGKACAARRKVTKALVHLSFGGACTAKARRPAGRPASSSVRIPPVGAGLLRAAFRRRRRVSRYQCCLTHRLRRNAARSKPAPTFGFLPGAGWVYAADDLLERIRRIGRPVGRLAFDFDLDLPRRKAERRFCAVGTAARMPQ